ncbi:hypothetical protein EGH24_08270 [Halonotius terrestris]|uniref:Polysaccharide biosynthesis protein n=1 Tax=Halonotius terrestris TaxID=2487750 RepID=A0A8J8P9S0_9EURY|nr:oligosaccharide flippase family protein [Halonotius terrestris]TQQ81121.1 hypothetical protein EGH24_08270 [Halonotius terrestris]
MSEEKNTSDIDPKDVSIGTEALSGGIARIALLGIGFLGSILFARILGATGFGAFYLLVTLENVVDRPIIGFAESVQKRLSESESEPRQYYGAFLITFAVFAVFISVVAIVGRDIINGYVQREDAFLLFIALFLALSAQEAFSAVFAATGRLGIIHWIDALRSFITIPTQVLLVLVGYGVVGMTVGLAGASLVTPLILVYLLGLQPTIPDIAVFRSLFEYAKYSVPNSITSFGYDRIALLILGFYLTPAAVGYFEAALKLTVPALAIGMMASGVLMPKISNLSSRNEDFSQELRDVMSYSSVFAIPTLFGAIVVSHKLMITIYGGEFRPAAKFLIGVAFYRLLTTRTKPLVSTLRGIDLPKLDLFGTILSTTVLLVVGIPALNRFGAMGMLGGVVAAAASRYVLNAWFVRREVGPVPHAPRPFIAQVVGGIIMLITLEIAKRLFVLAPWYRVFLLVGFGAVVYFVVVFAISPHVRGTVVRIGGDFIEEKLGITLV